MHCKKIISSIFLFSSTNILNQDALTWDANVNRLRKLNKIKSMLKANNFCSIDIHIENLLMYCVRFNAFLIFSILALK